MTETKYIDVSSNAHFANNSFLQIPKLCPICKVAHNPTISELFKSKISDTILYGYAQNCPNCNRHSFSLHRRYQDEDKNYRHDMLLIHPFSSEEQFSNLIEKLSPRFVTLYNQAKFCEDKGFTDLAATGYRSAIEILIKDYALDFDLDSHEDIAKQNLNNVISKYFKNDNDMLVSSDVVRIMGNSFTHWNKDEDASLDEIKYYMQIFVEKIQAKLRLKHPPVSRKGKSHP
ncbi:DUF4145 domain-containing protein [Staphylococcus xylosus]